MPSNEDSLVYQFICLIVCNVCQKVVNGLELHFQGESEMVIAFGKGSESGKTFS